MGPIGGIGGRAPHDLNCFDRGAMALLLESKKAKDLLAIGEACDNRDRLSRVNRNIYRTLQISRMFFNQVGCVRGERTQRDEHRMLQIIRKRQFSKAAKPLTLLNHVAPVE